MAVINLNDNAFAIIGGLRHVHRQLVRAEIPIEKWEVIQAEMTSGDNNHLKETAKKYFGDIVDFKDEKEYDFEDEYY